MKSFDKTNKNNGRSKRKKNKIKWRAKKLIESNTIVKKNYDSKENYKTLLKKKEIFEKFTNETMDGTKNLSKQIN